MKANRRHPIAAWQQVVSHLLLFTSFLTWAIPSFGLHPQEPKESGLEETLARSLTAPPVPASAEQAGLEEVPVTELFLFLQTPRLAEEGIFIAQLYNPKGVPLQTFNLPLLERQQEELYRWLAIAFGGLRGGLKVTVERQKIGTQSTGTLIVRAVPDQFLQIASQIHQESVQFLQGLTERFPDYNDSEYRSIATQPSLPLVKLDSQLLTPQEAQKHVAENPLSAIRLIQSAPRSEKVDGRWQVIDLQLSKIEIARLNGNGPQPNLDQWLDGLRQANAQIDSIASRYLEKAGLPTKTAVGFGRKGSPTEKEWEKPLEGIFLNEVLAKLKETGPSLSLVVLYRFPQDFGASEILVGRQTDVAKEVGEEAGAFYGEELADEQAYDLTISNNPSMPFGALRAEVVPHTAALASSPAAGLEERTLAQLVEEIKVPSAQEAAAVELAQRGATAVGVVPELMDLYLEGNEHALRALEGINAPTAQAARHLRTLRNPEQTYQRQQALSGLGNLSRPDSYVTSYAVPHIVSAFQEALGSQDDLTKVAAVQAIFSFGPRAHELAPRLEVVAAQTQDESLRISATIAARAVRLPATALDEGPSEEEGLIGLAAGLEMAILGAQGVDPAMPWRLLRDFDPKIYDLLLAEYDRQHDDEDLIASETYTHPAVLAAMALAGGLAMKYAEGYPPPGRRFYPGTEVIDQIETEAQQRWLKAFEHLYPAIHEKYRANLQPHSGSNANEGVYFAVLKNDDVLMGLDLAHGGHLTHGFPLNVTGKVFKPLTIKVNIQTGEIDFDALEERIMALPPEERPRLIVLGGTAYTRQIWWNRARRITDRVTAEFNATGRGAPMLLVADIAHNLAEILGGTYPHPFGYAHFVTTTTHKTGGPRSAVIFSSTEVIPAVNAHAGIKGKRNQEATTLANLLDRSIIPGMQGGPKEHDIAAKAVQARLFDAATKAVQARLFPTRQFHEYARQMGPNAKALAAALMRRDPERVKLIGNGTETHLMLLDVRGYGLTGTQAEKALRRNGLLANANYIPVDEDEEATRPEHLRQKAGNPAGIRIGVPAPTARGEKEPQMEEIAQDIIDTLGNTDPESPTGEPKNVAVGAEIEARVRKRTAAFPVHVEWRALFHAIRDEVHALPTPEQREEDLVGLSAGLEETQQEPTGFVAVEGVIAATPAGLEERVLGVTVGLEQTRASLEWLPPGRLVAVASGLEEVQAIEALGVPKDQILPTKAAAIRFAEGVLRVIAGLEEVRILDTTARTLGELRVWFMGLPAAWQGSPAAGLEQQILQLEELSGVGV